MAVLMDINKPAPPPSWMVKACEGCGRFTSESNIAWPKENFYRFVCEECELKRKTEQEMIRLNFAKKDS